jgi:hypothetical protein
MSRLKLLQKLVEQLGEKAQGSKFVQALEKNLPMDVESRLARGKELFPLEGYHATPVQVNPSQEFEALRPGLDELVHIGVDPDQAAARLQALRGGVTPGARTLKTKFRANKPIRISDPGSFDAWSIAPELQKQGILTEAETKAIMAMQDGPEQNRALKKLLSSKGHDAFVYKNTFELPKDKLAYLDALRSELDSVTTLKEFGTVGKAGDGDISPEDLFALEAKQEELQNTINKYIDENAKDSYAVFDASQVRSPTAVFDPAAVNEKNLLAGGAGAAVGLGLADEAEAEPAPETKARMTKMKKTLQSQYGKDIKNPNNSKYKDFLQKIGNIESTDRYKVEHPVIKKGMHKDSQAIGKYGLMPKTVKQIAENLKNKQSDLYKLMGPGYNDPEVTSLLDKDESEYKGILELNPNLQDKLANYLATDLSYKHNDDLEKMAYGWNQGSQIKSRDITPDKLEQSEYIKKFRKLNNPVLPDIKILGSGE